MLRALLRLGWPLALSGLVSVVISGNDTILLGTLGADAIAVGAVATGVYSVATALLNGFGIPAQVLTARHHGAGDQAAAARCVERAGAVALWVSVPLTLLFVLGATPIVKLVAGSAVDVDTAAAYLRITLMGLPVWAIGVVLRGFATGLGRSRIVLVSSITAAVLDIGMSLLLMRLGSGPLGVAIGTLLGSSAPAVIGLLWLRRVTRSGTPTPTLLPMLNWPGRSHKETWALGGPEALLLATGTASTVVVTVLLAPSGAVALATVRTLDVVERLVWVFLYGLASAATTLLAGRIGAGDESGQRRVIRVTASTVGTFAVACAVLLPLITPGVLRAVVDDARVADAAGPVVWIFWAQVVWMAATMTTNAVLRAHRDTRTPLRASLIGEYAVFLPLGWLLCRILDFGLFGIYVAHHVFWAAFLAIGMARARRHVKQARADHVVPTGSP